ncbi:MAG: PH domain-containing protein [Acidimicrobiales bacterium]|nr:PH domain-containing protein [Acidimicrobiales bacterium]
MRLDDLVDDDEEVLLDLRPHWSTVARPVLVVTVLVIAGITAAIVARSLPAAAWMALALVLLVGLCWLAGRYAGWACTRLVVTTERVVSQQGVLRRRWRQTPMLQITDVGVEQRLTERLLRKGSLLLDSGGPRGAERFTDVPRPWRVQAAISRQMDLARHRYAERDVMAPSASGSVVDQIEKLDALWRRGVINDTEFESLRAGLLGRG